MSEALTGTCLVFFYQIIRCIIDHSFLHNHTFHCIVTWLLIDAIFQHIETFWKTHVRKFFLPENHTKTGPRKTYRGGYFFNNQIIG